MKAHRLEPRSHASTRTSRESDARYRTLLRAAAEIVWTADPTGAFITEQHDWAAYTGQAFAEHRDRGWTEAVHPDDRKNIIAAWNHAVDDPTPWKLEYRLRRHDGEYRWFAVHAAPVMNGEHVVREWVGMDQDITGRKLAEHEHAELLRAAQEAAAEAERSKREADAASRAQSEFLATMSHEFRTPLNAIIGYAQLLDVGLAGPLAPQQADYLVRLTESAKHLLAIVNDVLDVAKAEAGRLSVARHPAMTGPAVAASMALMRPQAEANGVALVDLAQGTRGVRYLGDEDRVRQILTNLLSNAVKFTPSGGRVTVGCLISGEAPPEARLHGGGPWASIRVTDTGVGIAPDQQPAVFEAFHQVDSSRTRSAGGTGLGLAISRRLARLMGGDLTLTSQPDHGSVFTLWLPAATTETGEQNDTLTSGRRSDRAVEPLGVRGLRDVGEALRDGVNDILEAYTARLRADPTTPKARTMREPELEDHALSLLADVAQSLIIIAEAGEEAPMLLRDGSTIQRVVAERHGARRLAQGWNEEALRRDHSLMWEELERALREHLPDDNGDAAEALGVLRRLLERSEDASLAGWQRAAQRIEL